MVEYRPAAKESTQAAVETVNLATADARKTQAAETSQAVTANKVSDQAIARISVDQQSGQLTPADVAASKPSDLKDDQTESDLSSRETEVSAVKAAGKPIQNHPEILLANLAIKKTWHQNGKQMGTIRVDVEETLGHYAEWLNVSAREIRRLNGFRYGRALHINQKIKIPLHRVSQEEFVEKRFEYHQELAEDFFASYRVEKVRTYSIKRGDNIWTLSRQEFEVPLWLIKRYNAGVDFGSLMPSQKLIIPIIEKNV
jgi:membrane-bound lytic murein transglycosylase D